MSTKIFCDRCGKEYDPGKNSFSRVFKDGHFKIIFMRNNACSANELDLCYECERKLRIWVKEKE